VGRRQGSWTFLVVRHCERSDAIQGVLVRLWIASLRSQ
jgi:hypothetical protein